MMTAIGRRLSQGTSVLSVVVLCSCATTYTPNEKSNGPMSVEEARKVVSEVAKPPATFHSEYSGTYHVFYRSDMSSIVEDHYKVYLRTNSLRIVGKYKYDIPYKDLGPSLSGQIVSVFTSPGLVGSGAVFHEDGRGVANPADWHYFIGIEEAPARRLVDALSVLKIAAPNLAMDEEKSFQEASRAYRASNPKPQLPEAARRFQVQAQGAVQDKDYLAAADLYGEAIGVAPWWPEGHFNRALVLAETGEIADAITEMRRYLELAPDASDARAAQDKSYDWERKVN